MPGRRNPVPGLMVFLFQPSGTNKFGPVSSPIGLMFYETAGHNIAAEYTNLAPFLILMNSTYHQVREITRRASGNMQYDWR
jgi:hypothetical protein